MFCLPRRIPAESEIMQKITVITSRENPAVKHYIRLRDRKKTRYDENLFVAEGLRIVRDALQYSFLVQQIFLTEPAFEKYAGMLEAESGQLFRIPEALGREMSDTEHSQGVFAVCRMPEQNLKLSPEGRYLVLCQVQDPGNMGMILRTCDALGTDAVLMTQCCDLYSPKVIRATMGSVFRVPVLRTDTPEELLTLLSQQKICSYEGNGLPETVIHACQKAVTIPMKGGAESFNAAMAAGILTWEMMKSD